MKKIYSPDNYRAIFRDCPSIVITDDGSIYSGDHFNRLFPGTLLGRVKESAGEVFTAEKGLYSSPAYYFEQRGGEIRVYDQFPSLSASPIFYVRDNKIYTPENAYALFDNPAFCIRDLSEEEASAPEEVKAGGASYSGGAYGGGYAPRSSGYSGAYHEPGPLESFFSVVIVSGLLLWLAVAGFQFVTGTVIPGFQEDIRYEKQAKEERHMLYNETGVEWFSDDHYAITGYLGEIVPKDGQTMSYTPETGCTVRVQVTSDAPGLAFEAYVSQEPDSKSIGRKRYENGDTFTCEPGQKFTIVVNRLSGRGLYVADVDLDAK